MVSSDQEDIAQEFEKVIAWYTQTYGEEANLVQEYNKDLRRWEWTLLVTIRNKPRSSAFYLREKHAHDPFYYIPLRDGVFTQFQRAITKAVETDG